MKQFVETILNSCNMSRNQDYYLNYLYLINAKVSYSLKIKKVHLIHSISLR